MIEIKNNVFELIIRIAKELYPQVKADIWFAPLEVTEEGFKPYGCTSFPDDGSTPVIEIGLHTPIEAAPEIIAHEIAHVVAGKDAKHGKKWRKAFNAIHARWEEILKIEHGVIIESEDEGGC